MSEGPGISSSLPLAEVSVYVGSHLGLHFPPGRYKELQRGLEGASRDYGFNDVAACARWLLGQPPAMDRLAVLARHLTIGETYFFRDLQALELLSAEVLTPLVQERRDTGRYLRLWSAGCSTGEEAYTLAILLHRLIPDIARWNIVVMATDINAHALQKARAATYGEWSFRSAPAWLKRGYFERSADGRYTVKESIRRLVRFELMNLADTPHNAGGADLRNMDVILCRHVLMYFDTPRAARAAGHLHACLASGGWLVTSACEASPQVFSGFDAVTHSGAVLMRRREPQAHGAHTGLSWSVPGLDAGSIIWEVEPPMPEPLAGDWFSASMGVATPASPEPEEATPIAVVASPPVHPRVAAAPEPTAAERAHALAGQGRLDEALRVCDEALAQHKLDAGLHYVRAAVLLEAGDAEAAEAGLHRALYVEPEFVLAHVTRGRLAQRRGAHAVAGRHFVRARELLRRMPPDAIVPESEGMTAAALARMLQALLEGEGRPA